MEAKPAKLARVEMTRLMYPTDANVEGDVHGGVIMRLMDETGGVAAMRHCHSRVVTAVIDSMTFLSPVHVGDLLTVKATVNWVGNSSMEVGVRVLAENPRTGKTHHTGSGYLVYVALDRERRPQPVAPLLLETADEKRRMEAAQARQALRLKNRRQGREGKR